jgi:hypothetical protein
VVRRRYMRMRKWALLVVVLAVACSQSASNVATQTRLASPSPTPSDRPVATVDFTCRLPVSIAPQPGSSSYQGGFISFPSGKLTIDPAGAGGRYFDMAFSKWLPVERDSVAPDGRHYAFGAQTADNKPLLHVVSVPSGSDRVYSLPSDMYDAIGGIYVIDFQPNTVYMGLFVEGGIIGIWTLNLTTAQTVKIAGPENAWVMDGSVVWGTGFNQADPNPLSFPPGFRANEVERFDISDGSTTTWLYRPGNLVGVMGVDRAHHPIVGVLIDKDTAELLLLLDAKTQQTIYSGSSNSWIGNIDTIGGGIISDSHGMWMGSGPYGLYLYSAGAGVQRVSDLQSVRPANGCF